MKYTTLQCCTKKRSAQYLKTVYCVSHLEKKRWPLNDNAIVILFSHYIYIHSEQTHCSITKKVLSFFVLSHKIGIISLKKPFTFFILKNIHLEMWKKWQKKKNPCQMAINGYICKLIFLTISSFPVRFKFTKFYSVT